MIKAEEKSSYKWVIVIASFFVMVMVNGIIYNVFAVFTIPVTNDLGINRQSFSLAQTLVFIATDKPAHRWVALHHHGYIDFGIGD